MTSARLDTGGSTPDTGTAEALKKMTGPAGARLSIADCYLVLVDDSELAEMMTMLLEGKGAKAHHVRTESQTLSQLVGQVAALFEHAPAGKQLVLISDRDMGSGRNGEDLIKGVLDKLPDAGIHALIFSGGTPDKMVAGDHTHILKLSHVRATIGKPATTDQVVSTVERVINPTVAAAKAA